LVHVGLGADVVGGGWLGVPVALALADGLALVDGVAVGGGGLPLLT
jgi:hypothetical protein